MMAFGGGKAPKNFKAAFEGLAFGPGLARASRRTRGRQKKASVQSAEGDALRATWYSIVPPASRDTMWGGPGIRWSGIIVCTAADRRRRARWAGSRLDPSYQPTEERKNSSNPPTLEPKSTQTMARTTTPAMTYSAIRCSGPTGRRV